MQTAGKGVLFIALLLVIFGYASINLPLPVFPTLLKVFDITQAKLQLSVTVFLYAYASAQLVWGALTDSYGARIVLLTSTAIAIVGTILSLFADNFTIFFAGRFIEGLGIGAATTLARTILGDWKEGKALGVSLIYIVSVAALMPGVTPFVGSTLFLFLKSWRAVFLLLLLIGLFCFTCIFLLYQNKPRMEFKPTNLKAVLYRYGLVLRTPSFFRHFLVYGLLLGFLMSFYVTAPYIFLGNLHLLHPQYASLVLVVGVCYFASALGTRFLIDVLTMPTILILGVSLCMVSALLFLIEIWVFHFSAMAIILPMSIFALGCGLMSPPSNALALSEVSEKGSAAALMSCSIMVSAGCFSAIMAHLPLDQLSTYAGVLGAITVLCFGLTVWKR